MPMSFSSDVKAELAEYIAEARHCLIAELVGKNINNIRLLGLLCLRSFTTLQGEQA